MKLSFHVSEVPAATGLTETQVWAAIKTGELASFKEGRRRIIRCEALEEFLKRREAAGQPGRHGELDATGREATRRRARTTPETKRAALAGGPRIITTSEHSDAKHRAPRRRAAT